MPFRNRPAEVASGRAAQFPPLRGVVDFGQLASRQVSGLADIAGAATVSLIDTASNATKSTAKTSETGEFELTFSGGFAPAANTVYILEGIKGLDRNRPGSDAARVRTFVLFSAGSWSSMVAGRIYLDISTTALAIMHGYYAKNGRTGAEAQAMSYIGLIGSPSGNSDTPDTLAASQTVVDQATFELVHGYTATAVGNNQDPVSTVTYNSGTNKFEPPPSSEPRISDFHPQSGVGGSLVTIYGTNFQATPEDNLVTFNGAPAATPSVATKTKLVVTVPDDATTGDLVVQIGANRSLDGVIFTVVPSFGGSFKGSQ